MLAGRVAVLDLGAGTGDTYTIFDGNMNPDAIAHATDDRAGVISHLLKPILAEVMEAVPEAKHLTTAHIDSYLRNYVEKPFDRSSDHPRLWQERQHREEHPCQLRTLRGMDRCE